MTDCLKCENPLEIPEYTIEVWDWKTNKYIADISNILSNGLRIDWSLNDVEIVEFGLDLVQFQEKCKLMGVKPEEVLTPYIHDIRIKRNGEYIVGVQVVQLDFNLNSGDNDTIQVKCTGFLNIFKDQYISNCSWSGYTYSQLARRIVEESQKGDNLLRNGSFDINIDYWQAINGKMYRNTSQYTTYNGSPNLATENIAPGNWGTVATQVNAQAGEEVTISFRWRSSAESGATMYLRERPIPTDSASQIAIVQRSVGNVNTWYEETVTYKTRFDHSYLTFEFTHSLGAARFMVIDDVRVVKTSDRDSIHDHKVVLGTDTASASQTSGRQRNYELQNAKDAIMNLTKLDNDNFDFDFSYDRKFNVYQKLGLDKPDIEITWPGNVFNMTIMRTAKDLANKVTAIGSGIGDERIEVFRQNQESIAKYGVRENMLLLNNVSTENTLYKHATGEMWNLKDPTNHPTVNITDGSINPSNVKLGDSIMLKIENNEWLGTVNGMYRVIQYYISISNDNKESVKLTLEKTPTRQAPKMIRYIKSVSNGNSVNTGVHLVEIQALVVNGASSVNIAAGKSVWATNGTLGNGSYITNGNLDTNQYAYIDGSGYRGVVIDLGGLYPIDYIKVWHFYGDNRKYYNDTLSVGPTLTSGTNPLETVLWQNDSEYRTNSEGRISRWIQGDVQ